MRSPWITSDPTVVATEAGDFIDDGVLLVLVLREAFGKFHPCPHLRGLAVKLSEELTLDFEPSLTRSVSLKGFSLAIWSIFKPIE